MPPLDRRHFITQALAGMALALRPPGGSSAFAAQQEAAARQGRIDIHHHFAPPAWIAEAEGRPLLQAANSRWTVEQSLDDLDKAGTAAAVLSITNPGLWSGDAAATARVARACNDYGAELVQRHPTRFGLFAALPLNCCRNLGYGVAPNAIEYGTDTARALIGVTFSGDARRYPNIRFIWSHAGGSAPFFASRIDGQAATAKESLPDGFISEARSSSRRRRESAGRPGVLRRRGARRRGTRQRPSSLAAPARLTATVDRAVSPAAAGATVRCGRRSRRTAASRDTRA